MDNKNFQLLISTMNKTSLIEIENMLKENNISTDYLIVNQFSNNEISCEKFSDKILNINEKGLSKSRNKLLYMSKSEICLIADDDIYYYDDLENKILKAFQKNHEYDVITFYVERSDQYTPKKKGRKKELNKLTSLGIMSVQIAFKRKSIINANIQFDEMFGAGSDMYKDGEENIFLFDCFKNNLKILYLPITIAKTKENESTWFTGMDEAYLYSKGALFFRLFGALSEMVLLSFAILKYKNYRNNITFLGAIHALNKGKRDYKEYKKGNKVKV